MTSVVPLPPALHLELNDSQCEESPRQALINLLALFGTAPEREFDEIVELATALCGKPLGAMTLLSETSQYTQSTVGMPAITLPVEQTFCQFTLLQDEVMLVEDTFADSRFDHHHTTVHCDCGIRFYAGTPLTTLNGTRLGTLCVMDTAPSTLTAQQIRLLELLGRQISARLQLRERSAAAARMHEERERVSTMFDTILNNIPVELYLKDREGRLRFYNHKLAQRFKITETEWLGRTSYDLWDKHVADSITREDTFVLRCGRSHESFPEIAEGDGHVSYWRSMKTPCTMPDGELLLACCSIDITEQMERERTLMTIQEELEEANRKLNSLALTDGLTGLWNRRAFDARLQSQTISSHRTKLPVALLLLDVDNFKSVNDTHGHPYGDSVLRQIGAILNRCKRAEDVACRFGGEEFALLLPATGAAGAGALARRILAAMRAASWQHGPVTASIGVAICKMAPSAEILLDAADTALYEAKRSGKDRVVCHSDDLNGEPSLAAQGWLTSTASVLGHS